MTTEAPGGIEVRDVAVRFGGFQALAGVSLQARAGRITGLVGPNGAGKTTLFNVITSEIRPERGQVMLGGRDVTHTPPFRIAQQRLARTYQTPRGFPSLSVLDNVLVAAHHSSESLVPSLVGRKSPRALRERAKGILGRIGLASHADDQYLSLSTGELRLLEIARHLMRDPAFVLLDEPTAGVSPDLQGRLRALLHTLREEGKTLLCVEHNMRFLRDLADDVVVLDAGKILATGDPDEVFSDPKVIDAYLGKGGAVGAQS